MGGGSVHDLSSQHCECISVYIGILQFCMLNPSKLTCLTMILVTNAHVLLSLHTTCNPGTKPTLPELLKFTCTDKRVLNIPVEIATKYVQFGAFLLDDSTGSRVKILAHKHHYDAERINTEILQEWLTGRGKQPVTWTSLVEVFCDIELSTLAGEIKAVKFPTEPVSKDLR